MQISRQKCHLLSLGTKIFHRIASSWTDLPTKEEKALPSKGVIQQPVQQAPYHIMAREVSWSPTPTDPIWCLWGWPQLDCIWCLLLSLWKGHRGQGPCSKVQDITGGWRPHFPIWSDDLIEKIPHHNFQHFFIQKVRNWVMNQPPYIDCFLRKKSNFTFPSLLDRDHCDGTVCYRIYV